MQLLLCITKYSPQRRGGAEKRKNVLGGGR